MLKSSFKARCLFAVVFVFITFACSSPATAAGKEYYADGYTITAYDVHVNVNENNTLDLTEKIATDFSELKHGIYRFIPLAADVTWDIDGENVTNHYDLKIRDISVIDGKTGDDIPFKSNRHDQGIELKIGDENETFMGPKTYVIRYSLKVGNDGQEGFDEFYYNLIGTEWSSYIQTASFSIEMPKGFDQNKLHFTAGSYGSTDGSPVDYSVNGNTITGKTTAILGPGQGLTVRLVLPDGYFTVEKPSLGLGLIALFGAFLAASFVLFFLFGRDQRVYAPVEVAPPEGITPADAGYIIDGYADTKDVIALIIYWANRGYLTIESNSKDEFTLIKLKESDSGMKPYEQLMFEKLFEGRREVAAEDLKYDFNETIRKVLISLKAEFGSPATKLYTQKGNIAKACSYAMAGLTVGIMAGKGAATASWSLVMGLSAGVIAGFIAIGLALLIGYLVEKSRGRAKVGVILSSLLYAVYVAGTMTVAGALTGQYLAAACAGAAAIVLAIVGSYSKKRTPQGNLWLGRILGLREFIKVAEKDRMEALVETKPTLFYDILPYAYALGVTDKWAKKFESIAVPPPSWYRGTDHTLFNTMVFVTLMNHNMNAFQSSMVAKPPSDNSSGSGGFGGGFSGGGVGGGGGGSW